MYLSFYNLKSKPFQISSNPKFLWLGENHKEAFAILRYGILNNMGFLLLTGDVGTGKTTLINALLNSLDDNVIMASVPDPGLDRFDFFKFIADAFNMKKSFETKGDFLLQFRQYLNDVYRSRKKVLLLIDEAQRMNHDLLEEVRLLSNIERQDTKLLNIFFVGQNEFNDTLLKPENRALRQRITASYNIDPLTEAETGEYIRHRLSVAGCESNLFNSNAVHEIYEFSKGYPRLINIICDRALLTGYVREKKIIDAKIIEECAGELQITRKIGIEALKPHGSPEKPELESQPAEVMKNNAKGDDDHSGSTADNKTTELIHEKLPMTKKVTSLIVFFSIVILILGLLYYRKILQIHGLNDQQIVSGQNLSPAASNNIKTDILETQTQANKEVAVQYPIKEEEQQLQTEIINKTDQESGLPGEEPLRPSVELDKDEHSLDKEALLKRKFTVRFGYNSEFFSDEAYQTLDMIAQIADQHTDLGIVVKGYTDSLGDYHYNKRLSYSRANLVKSYLTGKGVSPATIETLGLGPENPIKSNDTAEGRNANRRVEIEFLPIR